MDASQLVRDGDVFHRQLALPRCVGRAGDRAVLRRWSGLLARRVGDGEPGAATVRDDSTPMK
jgi:hypothetical protein